MPRRAGEQGAGMSTRGTGARIAIGATIGGLSLLGAGVVGAAVLSVVAARAIIVPPSRRSDDIAIRRVDLDAGLIVLSSTADSRLAGEYSFWFAGDTGHARLGEIVAQTPTTVTRRILGVDFGDLTATRSGRLSGWIHLHPRDLGIPYREVSIGTPLGEAPAWYVPVDDERPSDDWVIQVHGRAVRRAEGLRAVAPFRAAGYDTLLVSYRNDGEAPRSSDYRYALGDREWRDIEAAMRYALAHGAKRIVLMGWSMGGATVLQALTRSVYSDAVVGVVLESPVVDWIATLDFQAATRRLPRFVRFGAFSLIRERWGRRLTGLAEPLDFERLDFVTRAEELDRPVLILHSDDDGFVPSTASRALAAARPDIVTLEAFSIARHTKLWNYDRVRWEGAITQWLSAL
jgi:alpha-beta hydrolase superfamily lysophospholipase